MDPKKGTIKLLSSFKVIDSSGRNIISPQRTAKKFRRLGAIWGAQNQ